MPGGGEDRAQEALQGHRARAGESGEHPALGEAADRERVPVGVAAQGLLAALGWGALHGELAPEMGALIDMPWGIAVVADVYAGLILIGVLSAGGEIAQVVSFVSVEIDDALQTGHGLIALSLTE